MFLAFAWVRHGRFPSEVRALPRGEQAFLRALHDEVLRNESSPNSPPPQAGGNRLPQEVLKKKT